MPKGRDIESYYDPDLAIAMRVLKSDISILSDLQPYLRFYTDNAEFNSFVSGTYYGHVLNQMFYVYLNRSIMIVCKVLDGSADAWGFLGCYRRAGSGTVVARELAFMRARNQKGYFETTPPNDPMLMRWMQREAMAKARAAYKSVAGEVASLEAEHARIVDMASYKRVRVFRSEKIAHALIGSHDRRKFSKSGPVGDPDVKCVLEISGVVIDYAENFFGSLSNVWPGFKQRQTVTGEYLRDFLRQLQYAGKIEGV